MAADREQHSSSNPSRAVISQGEAQKVVRDAARRYADKRRAMIADFAKRTFGLGGAVRLHRHALGWDMLRAPANVVLTLPYLATRIAATASRRMRHNTLADWLQSRRIFLTSDVAREIEWRLFAEFLELPYIQGQRMTKRDALAEEIFADPRVDAAFKVMMEAVGKRGDDEAFRAWLTDTLAQYTASRIAAADLANSILSTSIGALTMHTWTPGTLSLGPVLAQAIATKMAIASFPLGAGLGGLWYGAFPASASAALTVGLTGGIIASAAVLSAFSGIVTDPLQRRLGIHQRRLERLVNLLEKELTGEAREELTMRDHYVARVLDVLDLVAAISRAAR